MISFLLGIIPALVNGAVAVYTKSKDVSITAIQSAVGIAGAQAQAMTAWIGHPFSPPSICCYGVAIWFFKVTACDKVIGPALGYHWTTDPLTGGTAEIAMIVVSGMFFSGIANIIRKGQ